MPYAGGAHGPAGVRGYVVVKVLHRRGIYQLPFKLSLVFARLTFA